MQTHARARTHTHICTHTQTDIHVYKDYGKSVISPIWEGWWGKSVVRAKLNRKPELEAVSDQVYTVPRARRTRQVRMTWPPEKYQINNLHLELENMQTLPRDTMAGKIQNK